MAQKRTAVAIDYETLGLLRRLRDVSGEPSQSAIVARLVTEEVARRGGLQVFEPKKEIDALRELCMYLDDWNHKSFVASAKQQRQLIRLEIFSNALLSFLDDRDPGVHKIITELVDKETEAAWIEAARGYGYAGLPVEEGGLGEV